MVRPPRGARPYFHPGSRAADDAIMSVDQYKTANGPHPRDTHQALLKQVREEIYQLHAVGRRAEGGHRLRQPKGAVEDDRYLSVWIVIDQDEDARFAALPPSARASAMFSRYGTDLLRRMAQLQPLVAVPTVKASRWSSRAEAGYRRRRAAHQRDARRSE